MFDVEKGFITKLLVDKDISFLKDYQIKERFFTGDNRVAFKYILEAIQSTGEVPTVRAFSHRFPSYKLEKIDDEVGTEENLKYWCEELRKKVKQNTMADMIEEVAGKLEDFDSEGAYTLLKKDISYMENEVELTSDVDITKNTEDRKKAYLDRKINKGMRGIPTGLENLDFMMKGLENETLTTLIALSGVGKTWFEILLGCNCLLDDYKVLQLVTEMSEDIMRDRYDAMLYSMCYGDLDYGRFKSGSLDKKTEDNYFKFLEKDLPDFNPLIIATATGVMGVEASIEKYDPDIVFIDSAYLMEDDSAAESDWLRVAHITRDLKKLAKRKKKPIFINSQADKNTSKKTGPGLESIMYTQAIAQDSDNVLALYRDELMINDREMCIKILKQREGTLGKCFITWDFKKMSFQDIYMESASSDFGNTESDEEEDSDNTIGIEAVEE
jgi:replicative DNA helicase